MSKREKVFDDPLSMFGVPTPDKEEEDEEPVSFKPQPGVTPPPSSVEEPIFREIDASKITFKKDKKKVEVAAEANLKLSENEKGLGYSVNLWDNKDISSKKPTKEVDIFASTDSYKIDDNDNLFGFDPKKHVSKSEELITGKATISPKNNIQIRGAKDEEESNLTDLSVSRLLEREEALDYDMFGKVKIDENVKVVKQIKQNKDLFENVSEDYLNELEALTSTKSTTSASTSTKKTPATFTAAPVKEIDMSSLDLDAYINQQEESSGGGLFD